MDHWMMMGFYICRNSIFSATLLSSREHVLMPFALSYLHILLRARHGVVSTPTARKYFPREKVAVIWRKIIKFKQTALETIAEAWEKYEGHLWACPNHVIKEEFILQNFYDGLTQATKKQLDAVGKRTFSPLSIQEATSPIEEAIHIYTYVG